jgi:hypothetical protein
VRAAPAAAFVARALEARRTAAADPRAALLAWLVRLEDTPGLEFRASAELLDAVTRMPDAAFRVPPTLRPCAARRDVDLPDELRSAYASGEPAYDAVAADAHRLRAAGAGAAALRTLSSLVEAHPGDTALARDVGFSALEWGLADQAYHVFRRVAHARPYEPETWRALVETLVAAGRVDLALVHAEVAVGATWDSRFGAFRSVAAMDYRRLLRRIERGELRTSLPEFAAARRAALEEEFGTGAPGLVVVLTWNTDRTDVDLHVTDPTGDECSYQQAVTATGGSITADVTQGFGPEMFVLPTPRPGAYVIDVHAYASDRNRASLRSKVLVTAYQDWGTSRERVVRRTVDLREGKQRETVAVVHVGP